MSHQLEEFVKNNKKQFDSEGPSPELWKRIEAGLDQKKPRKTIRMYQWMSIAALLLISLGVYFSSSFSPTKKAVQLADVNPEIARKSVHFASLIEEKKDSLQVYAKDNPELYQSFTSDMEKLDKDFHQLQQQLQNSPNQKTIVRAMMKNLEIQLQVLNQQLLIINQVNQYNKENSI